MALNRDELDRLSDDELFAWVRANVPAMQRGEVAEVQEYLAQRPGGSPNEVREVVAARAQDVAGRAATGGPPGPVPPTTTSPPTRQPAPAPTTTVGGPPSASLGDLGAGPSATGGERLVTQSDQPMSPSLGPNQVPPTQMPAAPAPVDREGFIRRALAGRGPVSLAELRRIAREQERTRGTREFASELPLQPLPGEQQISRGEFVEQALASMPGSEVEKLRHAETMTALAEQIDGSRLYPSVAESISWVRLAANAESAPRLDEFRSWVLDVEEQRIEDVEGVSDEERDQMRSMLNTAAQPGDQLVMSPAIEMPALKAQREFQQTGSGRVQAQAQYDDAMARGDFAEASLLEQTLGIQLGGRQSVDLITPEQMIAILRLDPSDTRPFNNEVAREEMRREGVLPTAHSGGLQVDLGRQVPGAPSYAQGRSMSYVQAINMLYNMSEEEIGDLQDRMRDAGMFGDQEPMFRGDPSDRLTQQAWRGAVNDSVAQRMPIYELFSQRTSMLEQMRQEDELEVARQQQAMFNDLPVQHMGRESMLYQANIDARNIIGRELDSNEAQMVIEFVRNLERSDARAAANFELGSVSSYEELSANEVRTRVNQRVASLAPEEAGERRALDVFRGINDEFKRWQG